MKSNYEIRAKKFVRQFFATIPAGFFTKRSVVERMVNDFNHAYNRKVRFYYGISRYAFITSDYVIKVDYDYETGFGGCADEYRVYQQALKDNKAYLFAKITPYQYNGITFWIMPKITGIGKTEEYAEYYFDDEDYKYCIEHLELSDLHNENYGWKNDYPVLIDYAARGR